MGMSFHMQAVKPTADGRLVDIPGQEMRAWVPNNQLFGVLDRIEERKRRGGLQPSLFPWYQKSFDYDSGRQPAPADCCRPRDVLSSLQTVERELQKNSSRYPFESAFWLLNADGTRHRLDSTSVYYRGKPCRLFGDERGVWAVETNTPLAFPVHHDLTELAEVTARFQPDGPDVAIRIERTSFLVANTAILQKLKQLCLVALPHDALLLTSIG